MPIDIEAIIADLTSRRDPVLVRHGEQIRIYFETGVRQAAESTPHSEIVCRRRNWLKKIKAAHFPDTPITTAAKAIEVALRKYRDRGGWARGHKHLARCPDAIDGELDGLIWRLFKDVGDRAFGWSTINRDLSA